MSKRSRENGAGSQRAKKSRKMKRSASNSDESENESEIEEELMDVTNSTTVIEDSRLIVSKPSKGASKFYNGTCSLPGVILRVSVHNFMCHNHLEVHLGGHVNFIVGRNGTGKSAVVTALVIALGGKASVTNRGSSIKNFVKTGKRSAWVEVAINNRGKDAFKPEIYGDTIVVRRSFTAEGSSSYKIKSVSAQLVTEKKDELTRITDHMNIQVDNPVSILNQDTSRNFLNGKTAADKYKFFMRATSLEQMKSEYDQVKKVKEQTRQIILSKDQTIPKMKSEVKVWENKFKNLTAISDLKKKIKHLRCEMAWALVAGQERQLLPKEKELDAEEVALPKFVGKVDQAKAQVQDCEKQHKHIEERLILCGQEVKELQPRIQAQRKALHTAKEAVFPLVNELRACERDLRTAKQECHQCEVRIDELKTMATHDFEADRRLRESKMDKLRVTLKEFEGKKAVAEHDLEQYRGCIAKYKADIGGLESQIRKEQNKVRETKNTIQTLHSARNDRLQRFGQWVPAVVNRIKDLSRKFHKPPRGPLGANFTLTDQKWALAIECCLKSLVSAFVVHDHHDEKLLEEIFNNTNCPKSRRPTIIRCAFSDRLHNVSNQRVRHPTYPCILDVVKCNDPVIVNTLIDQRGIENVLLIEDSTEARNVMNRNPPRGARECFTVTGDQALCVPTFRYYTQDNKTTARYLMANVDEQISSLKREQTVLEESLETLSTNKNKLNSEIIQNQRKEKECQTGLNRISDSLNRLRFDIEELQNVEDPAPVDVTTLEAEVQAYKAKMREIEDNKVELGVRKKAAEASLEREKEAYTKLEAEIRDRSDNELPLREEIAQAQNHTEKAKNDLKHYQGRLKKQESRIGDLKKEIDDFKKELDKNRNQALQISQPIATDRLSDDIENEIRQIQKRIEEEEDQHGNAEEITNTFAQKKSGLQRVVKEVSQLKSYLEKLDDVMERRIEAYQKMRERIANRTKFHFLMQMHHRSYTGKMDFNFAEGTLNIQVTTSQGQGGGGRETKDLKSLSGGERSFSTVCFILALWEAMESPFRCLDEFDVFMDMVNRRISMDMMLETADMHKNMQFIFLTPQDMSALRKIEDVRIFRMPDPERSNRNSQNTLDFSQLQA